MSGYSEFKEGVKFPDDGRVTVIGGVDASGNVVPVAATPSGSSGYFEEQSGNLDMTSAASALTVDCDGASSICVQFVRVAQTGSIQLQGSVDGTTFSAIYAHRLVSSAPTSGSGVSINVASGSSTLFAPARGLKKARIIVSSTGTGSLPTVINASSQSPGVIHGILPGTGDLDLGKAEDSGHSSGDVGVMALAVRNDNYNSPLAGSNADYSPIAVTNRGVVHVLLAGETNSTVTACRFEDEPLGNAHGALVTGSQSSSTLTSDVSASGDLAFLKSDMLGRLLVNPFGGPPGTWFNAVSAAATDTSDTLILAAGAAGVRHYITDIVVVNRSGVASEISIKDGSTVKLRYWVPANGAVSIPLRTPISGTAATAINFAMTTTATDTIVTANGFSLID